MDLHYLEKVTALVTRPGLNGWELLLFQHPHAGIQLPAGTVEEGEDPRQAVVREVREECGLEASLETWSALVETRLPPGERAVLHGTRVYARPDPASFDWAVLRRGITVREERRASGFVQVTYEESNRLPDPEYITYRITGWVPEGALAAGVRRHFFHLRAAPGGPSSWEQSADGHTFRPFWAPMDELPALIPPQQSWLDLFRGYWTQARPGNVQ